MSLIINLAIDLILVVIALVYFVKFVKYKKMAEKEFANFEERLAEEQSKAKEAQLKYESEQYYLKSTSGALTEETFNQPEGVNSQGAAGKGSNEMFAEITQLRKEKEEELKLRLEAEKQVALALQKAENIEQRLADWKDIQEVNMQDAIDTITKISDDLHDKLADESEHEVEEIKDEIHNVAGHICEYLDEIIQNIEALSKGKEVKHKEHDSIKRLDNHQENKEDHKEKAETDNGNSQPLNIPDAQQCNKELENIFQKNGLEANKDYFTNDMIDEKIRKSVPFDAFFSLSKEDCIIIDTKSLNFFKELERNKIKNSAKAYEIFKAKIQRYVAYLTKAQYRSNIVNYFASRKVISKNAGATVVMLLPLKECENDIKKIDGHLLETLKQNYIQLHDPQSINKLIKSSD